MGGKCVYGAVAAGQVIGVDRVEGVADGDGLVTNLGGRFTEPAMWQALRHLAEQLRVPHGDTRLLRLTNNAVFALPRAGLVVRITRSHGLRRRVHKVTDLAVWFAQVDASTIRLAPEVPVQPVEVTGLLATVWRYLPSAPPVPTLADLGVVLREFHRLGAPPLPLPGWNPVADARARIDDAEALADHDRELLTAWCDRLEPQLVNLRTQTPAHLVHGDAYVGNLLREPGGRAVLCDFDATCLGPWQVDLAAVAVGEIRFGHVGDHAALAAAYGYDVTDDPDWPVLRQARELKMIAAAVPLLASAPGVATEFSVRLRSITEGDDGAAWTPFAVLKSPR
jgi:hypothetical protein